MPMVLCDIAALLFGLVTIGLSFVAEEMTKSLIEAIPTVWSLIGGPIAGVFILGLLFPCTNSIVSRQRLWPILLFFSLH